MLLRDRIPESVRESARKNVDRRGRNNAKERIAAMNEFYLQYETPVTEEQIGRLRSFTTPELCDGVGLYHTMDAEIRHRAGKEKIVGRAVTVEVPSGDGGLVADAILHLKKGDVLVEPAMEKALDKRLRQEATIREMQETGKILVKVKPKLPED